MLKLARLLAWTLVAALIVATLVPIDFRPVVSHSANLERAVAYALLGFLMALAYPRHRLLALAVGVAIAAGLELGQVLTASRHGRVPDFVVKSVAAGLGVLAAHMLITVQARWERRKVYPGG